MAEENKNCICRQMTESGTDMHVTAYRSPSIKDFYLREVYGVWFLESCKSSIKIYYCPFCGRKLSAWN